MLGSVVGTQLCRGIKAERLTEHDPTQAGGGMGGLLSTPGSPIFSFLFGVSGGSSRLTCGSRRCSLPGCFLQVRGHVHLQPPLLKRTQWALFTTRWGWAVQGGGKGRAEVGEELPRGSPFRPQVPWLPPWTTIPLIL